MKTYLTSEVAQMIGIHPNTVRLYETLGLISKPERRANGYRIFTDFHVAQFRLARTALEVEVLQNGLRKIIIQIIKTSANKEFDSAIRLTDLYLHQLKAEQDHAEEAITLVIQILEGHSPETDPVFLTRKEAADTLNVTIDTLRNWELNGLLTVKRRQNGNRVYTNEDLKRLKIIRSLRCANYSLSAILRMLEAISCDPRVNIKHVINTPHEEDDIISVCDKLMISLKAAKINAQSIRKQLEGMKQNFS